MPQVVVQINSRNYTMECGEGQEEHLRRLARLVDAEVARVRGMAGPVGEIRLLIMAALVIADKLSEQEGRIAALEKELAELREQAQGAGNTVGGELLNQMMKGMEQATDKLQAMARRATTPPPDGNT